MSEFSVKTDIIAKVSSDLQNISDKINNIASQTESTLKNTRKSCTEDIFRYGKDKIVISSILNCKQDILTLSAFLTNTATIYEKCEKNVADKKFSKNKKNSLKKTARFNGYSFTEGQSIARFKVVEITDSGDIIIERDKHIFLDSYDFLSKIPILNTLILGPLMKKTGFNPEQLVGVKQKIIIESVPKGKKDGQFNNLGDFDGEASGYVQKITYIAESDDYKSEIEFTSLEGSTGIGANPLEDVDWLSPAMLIKASGTGTKIKGKFRHGTEKDNITTGFDINILDGSINMENGIGNVEFTDAAGESHRGNGFIDEKGASASCVSGRVYVQGTVNSVKNTIAVTGGAGGAGGRGEVAITDNGVAVTADAEILAGLGLAISSVWGD